MATTNDDSTTTASPMGVSVPQSSLLKLPIKVRERIYNHLLDLLMSKSPSRRHSNWKPTTTFFATSRQLHDEASAVLFEHRIWTLKVDSDSSISFAPSSLRIPTKDLLDETIQSVSAVNKIKHLRVRVDVTGETDVCETQHALFKFFDTLGPDHQLHRLEVEMRIEEPGLWDEDEDEDEDEYLDSRQRLKRELSEILPDSYDSRPHTAAFLADPLRNIRLKPDGEEKGMLSLVFPGHTRKLWSELTKQLRDLTQGQSPPRDYKAFIRYYDIRRQMEGKLGTLYRWQDKMGFYDDFDEYDGFYGKGRRRGREREDDDYGFDAANRSAEVTAFHKSHHRFVKSLKEDIDETFGNPLFSLSVSSIEEHLLQVVEEYEEKLEAALPSRDTNTDHYGFRILHGEVDAWLRWGKAQAVAERKERKRKRETNEE
jgi:hypothetical protein